MCCLHAPLCWPRLAIGSRSVIQQPCAQPRPGSWAFQA
jgi:hypothetical protein